MQNGTPYPIGRLVKTYLQEEKANLLHWLGNSPDMTPIEIVWELSKRKGAKNLIKTKEFAKNHPSEKLSFRNPGDNKNLQLTAYHPELKLLQ